MPDGDKYDFAKHTQDHINKYIILADQKLFLILTAIIAFLGLYSNVIGTYWSSSPTLFKILSVVTVTVGFVGSILAGWAVFPRTPGSSQSLILWSSIQNRSMNEYQRVINELESDEILEETTKEVYQLASVSEDKYQFLRFAMLATGLMIVLGMLSIIFVV